jgi:mono/diheme cytochrome c family protein
MLCPKIATPAPGRQAPSPATSPRCRRALRAAAAIGATVLNVLAGTLASSVARPAAAADFSSFSGAELYHRFCESCHGKGGAGDGPVAGSLKLAVPDLTRIAERHHGEFPDNWVYRVIDGQERLFAHGSRDMPVWGIELWREQGADVTAGAKTQAVIDRLVEYLRSLQAHRTPRGPGPDMPQPK